MSKLKRNKQNKNKLSPDAIIMMAAFMYLSLFMEENKGNKPSEEFKRYFQKLSFVTVMFREKLPALLKEIRKIVLSMKFDKDIDYILTVATLIAEYYEQTRGRKRLFNPMSYDNILNIQDEAIENLRNLKADKMIDDSMNFARDFVHIALAKKS